MTRHPARRHGHLLQRCVVIDSGSYDKPGIDHVGAVLTKFLTGHEAIELLDRLERHLADQRSVMVPPNYGAADVVWTVFLARMGSSAWKGRSPAGRPSTVIGVR